MSSSKLGMITVIAEVPLTMTFLSGYRITRKPEILCLFILKCLTDPDEM